MKFKTKLKYFLFDLFDMVSFLIFVGGIVLFIRFFVANPYTVVGASMEPTFNENDFIIIDKITPRFSELQRGDIIVFVPPGKSIPYIKRIIGLPGETVNIKHNNVEICKTENNIENNTKQCYMLDELYLDLSIKTESRCDINEFTIDNGGFFVMGDNRGFSTDSRCCFGLDCYEGSSYEVPYDHIIGKVYIRFFPHFQVF